MVEEHDHVPGVRARGFDTRVDRLAWAGDVERTEWETSNERIMQDWCLSAHFRGRNGRIVQLWC